MSPQSDGTFVNDDRPWLFVVGLLVFAVGFSMALWNRIATHGIDIGAIGLAFGLGAIIVGALAVPATRFVFDTNRKQIRWNRRSFLAGDGGQLDFANVRSVIVQTYDDPGRPLTYRVALETKDDVLPLAIEYTGDKLRTEQLAAKIRELLNLPTMLP